MSVGTTRKPPQKEGMGTSPSLNFRLASSHFISSSERVDTTWLCGDAQAPIWLPKGRLMK